MQKSHIMELAGVAGIAQLVLVLLKIFSITSWSWIAVLWPTWLPLTILLIAAAVLIVRQRMLPPKKNTVSYTSNRWMETLAEINYSRLN